MTREEAIRQLDGAEMMLLNREFKPFNQAILMAIAALREQEGKDTNVPAKWISVEEKLPPPYMEVLAYRKNHSREGGFATLEHLILWHDETLVWNNDTTTWRSKVTHWMPLPSTEGLNDT